MRGKRYGRNDWNDSSLIVQGWQMFFLDRKFNTIYSTTWSCCVVSPVVTWCCIACSWNPIVPNEYRIGKEERRTQDNSRRLVWWRQRRPVFVSKGTWECVWSFSITILIWLGMGIGLCELDCVDWRWMKLYHHGSWLMVDGWSCSQIEQSQIVGRHQYGYYR